MFNWKVEEMKLMNSKKNFNGAYFLEDEVSREDKIAFVDSMQDGKLSYIIAMIQKFESERDSMPKDQWGKVKTVSLKAWLKRNDTGYKRPIFNNDYYYGKFYLIGVERFISSNPMNSKGNYYDIYEDLVDEVFYRQLCRCEKLEKEYFLAHDEYSILKKQFRELSNEYRTTFGVHTGYCSNGEIYVYDENHEDKREITIEELKILIDKYDALEQYIQELSNQLEITYEKPIEEVKLVWECTDPDCIQYQKNYGTGIYHMIQIISPNDSDDYFVVSMVIDINDYDEDERKDILSAYYDSFDNISDNILAECIFEQECLSSEYIVAGNLTEDEAKKYIQEYIKTR